MPRNDMSIVSDTLNHSVVKIEKKAINRDETFYIYLLITQPSFNKILLDGKNLTFSKVYTYKEFLESEVERTKTEETSTWTTFLYLLFGGILVVVALYFLAVVYTILSKVMHWE